MITISNAQINLHKYTHLDVYKRQGLLWASWKCNSEYIHQWLCHQDCPIGPYDIAALFGKPYLPCQTGLIVSKGFLVTGIHPCERTIFDDNESIASECSLLSQPVQDILVSDDLHGPSKDILQGASCSKSMASAPKIPCLSPQDIMSVPKLKRKISNKGWKASSASVITDSPYKLKLQ